MLLDFHGWFNLSNELLGQFSSNIWLLLMHDCVLAENEAFLASLAGLVYQYQRGLCFVAKGKDQPDLCLSWNNLLWKAMESP